MELFNPTIAYISKHNSSKNYLNSAKFCFNWDLFTLSRNINYTHEQRVNHIADFLKQIKHEKPVINAEKIVSMFENAKIEEFRKLNVNDKL